MVQRICQIPSCGKEFRANPCKVDRGDAKYCSRECFNLRTTLEKPLPTCSIDDRECTYNAERKLRRGLCQAHYGRWKRDNPVHWVPLKCDIEDCLEPAGAARGLCSKHYARWLKYGDPLKLVRGLPRTESCSVNDSECSYGQRDALVMGMCQLHYSRLRRLGSTENTWSRVVCAVCGEEFDTESNRAVTCSDRCGNIRRGRPPHDPIERKCEHCPNVFMTLSDNHRFCSGRCRAAWFSQKRRHDLLFIEPVAIHVLADRDGYTCQLCDSVVDMELRYPDPQSASIDHVVPVSLGGEHSYANTQLAHLTCNIRKGNRVDVA